MKRLYFILTTLLFISISLSTVSAQSNNTVYLIGTSADSPDRVTGLNRVQLSNDNKLHIGDTYSFIIRSYPKDFHLYFMHINYNLVELAKKRKVGPRDTKTILTKPRSELSSYANVVDVDEFIRTKTQAQAWEWAESLKDKKIYVIDRKDFFTQNGVEKMKLIEVDMFETNEPVYDMIILDE